MDDNQMIKGHGDFFTFSMRPGRFLFEWCNPDTDGLYFLSCFVVLLVSTLREYVLAQRNRMVKIDPRTRRQQCYLLLLHLLYIFITYMLMLVAMVYNGGLFLCLLGGLVLGYALRADAT